jgi:hypothetical protein
MTVGPELRHGLSHWHRDAGGTMARRGIVAPQDGGRRVTRDRTSLARLPDRRHCDGRPARAALLGLSRDRAPTSDRDWRAVHKNEK